MQPERDIARREDGRSLCTLLSLLCATMLAGPARAQEVGTGLRATVDALYDDNFLRANRLRPAPNQADVRITPALEVDISRTRGRYRLFLKGEAGYDFHVRNPRLDSERIGLTGGGRIRVGGFCAVEASARIDRRQVDIADLGIVQPNRLLGQTYQLGASCPRPAGLYPVLTATYARIENSNELREPFDLETYGFDVGATYARPSLGTATLFYSYAVLDRPSWPGLGLVDENRTEVHNVGLRLDRAVANRLRGGIGAWLIHTNPPGASVPAFTGVGWRGSLSWLPSPATTITADTAREVRGESSFGAAYLIVEAASLAATHRIGYRTVVEGRAAVIERDLRGETPVLALPLRGSDRTLDLRLVVRRDIGRRIRLAAEVGHAKRDADNPFYDFRSTRVGLRTGLRF